jgi:hypothetical protein
MASLQRRVGSSPVSSFTPVVGPIFLGGLVAVGYTAVLFSTGGGDGGAYIVLGIAFAPLAYGFSALAIADGIMQGVFLKQAFGWSDPPRSSMAAQPVPSVGRRLLSMTPMIVPEVQPPAGGATAGVDQRVARPALAFRRRAAAPRDLVMGCLPSASARPTAAQRLSTFTRTRRPSQAVTVTLDAGAPPP